MMRVIAYDIRSDRRRRKILNLCRDYGVRCQYSVFLCDLSEENWQRFLQRLQLAVDPAEDSILIFPLCGKCRGEQIALGQGKLYEKPKYYIF